MEQLASLERDLEKLYENIPHLPKGLRDWLGENAWWLVVIGVVLGVVNCLGLLVALSGGSLLVGLFLGPTVGGIFFLAGLVSLAATIAVVVVEAMAIQPLQHHQKRGWSLLFLALLISVAGSIVSSLVSLNIGGIIAALVGAFIGFYILYEIRGQFAVKKK